MKYRMILILLMITGLFLCLISVSSVAAIELKPIKPLVTLEKNNISPTDGISTIEKGTTLFDGKQIIQSPEVISNALIQLKSGSLPFNVIDEEYFSAPLKTEPYSEWTLRQFADYLADNSSRYIIYSLVKTDGNHLLVSSGVLGYSRDADLIIGDKYDCYMLRGGVSDVPDNEFYIKRQDRLIIDPDENHLILQTFDPSSSSPSPSAENTISLETVKGNFDITRGYAANYYGKSHEGIPSNTIAMWPFPLPE
ncbi:hypothetical protein ACKUB1_01025 [Methanospirillum stamsii]|nr:hypothetical protein [Methanospirillum stamsii]